MNVKDNLERVIGEDASPNAWFPQLHVSIDDQGDVWLMGDDGTLLLSAWQAAELHKQLGMMLIQFHRSWGAKFTHESRTGPTAN